MKTPVNRLEGSEAITSLFGYWPSFHDAEVLEIAISRASDQGGGVTLCAAIHVFEMTNQVDPNGYFICHKHSVVTLMFQDIDELSLDGFNQQNALSQLSITESTPGDVLRINFESAYGLESEFTCLSAKVVSVVPGIPPGSVYARRKV